MKATAKAHPIQGLVKYHGMRDEHRRRRARPPVLRRNLEEPV